MFELVSYSHMLVQIGSKINSPNSFPVYIEKMLVQLYMQCKETSAACSAALALSAAT